jgi:hypothetical protein
VLPQDDPRGGSLRALNAIRETPGWRRRDFDAGLEAAGFEVVSSLAKPEPADLLVLWNRYTAGDEQARHFEAHGARVLVVENGYLGKNWRGGTWLSMGLGHHAGAGTWGQHGDSRWDGWGIALAPWRDQAGPSLIFGQRGFGHPDVRAPVRWAESARSRFGGRIRPHPADEPTVPLERDLEGIGQVLTWHSAAALIALAEGIPAWYEFPRWLGAPAARPLSEWGQPPRRDDAARLAAFRRLAWATWTPAEIASGEAIRSVLA